MFLWEQGKFQRFLHLIQQRDKSGYNSYFEAALEKPVEQIVPLWKDYLNKTAVRRNDIMRLPPSAIFTDEQTFNSFTNRYGVFVK